MSQTQTRSPNRARLGTIAVLALLAAALWPFRAQIIEGFAELAPHAPDWALWARLSFVLQVHIIAAVAAVGIGAALMLRPKGRGMHKALGWSWVAAMGVTAISSLFITGLNGDAYSLIHLLSGWTLIALPMAVYAIRNRKVEAHRRMMMGMFYGGLLVAAALTFIPGRFMFEFLIG
jgi:uncharacterized membrane protein